MMSPDDFYEWHEEPRQGDIVLCGVSRIIANDRHSPLPVGVPRRTLPPGGRCLGSREGAGHRRRHRSCDGRHPRLSTRQGVEPAGSRAAEGWNGRRTSRTRSHVPMRHSTERSSSARSSIPPTFVGGVATCLQGRVIGYLPVPTHPEQLVTECVVDLTYQCTVDRLDVVKVASVSEAARKQLRYALIHLDALRTADLGFEVEAVVGRTIQKVEVPARDPLTVRILLDDGNVIQLLQQPGIPGPGDWA